MRRFFRFSPALGLLALGGVAGAQSVYVDLNLAAGAGAGSPSSSFAGAAGAPGAWNNVTSASPATVALVGLDGMPTAVTLSRATNGFFSNKTHPGTTGDAEKLLDDVQVSQANQTLQYTFNNLEAGVYLVYTYAGEATYAWPTRIGVTASDGADLQNVDGADANDLLPGVAYSVHGKSVQPGGSITVVATATAAGADVYVAGIQLRKLDGPRARVYVDKNAPGAAHDGASWAGAFLDPQHALDVATRGGGSRFDIWTASAIYTPTSGTTRTVSFTIPTGAQFRGGFNGDEATLADRPDPRAHPTYLSGGIGSGASTDNSFTVLDASDTTGSTLVEGFFITSGYANQVQGNDGSGAGVRLVNGSAVFRSCNIINNTATFAGAGVFSEGGAPTFVDCIFFNNHNINGEGGAVHHASSIYYIDLWNCEFLGNVSVGPGGGVGLFNTHGRLVNCLFSGNSSSTSGGGLYVTGSSGEARIINSTFSNNDAASAAGGVHCRAFASLILNNSILWGNTAGFGTAERQNLTVDGVGMGTTYSLQRSTIEGISTYSGVGVNGADPHFVNAAGSDGNPGNFDDDCRLSSASTLINSGDVGLLLNDLFDLDNDGALNEQTPIDLAGKARRIAAATHPNTGVGPAPFVDRGAFEFVPSCPGDTNGDFLVNFLDLNQVLSQFGQSGVNLAGDVNGDHSVDFRDLNIVLSSFGAEC